MALSRHFIAAAVLILSICFPALSQNPKALASDTLAEVGPRVITEEDLLERLELMPWLGKEKKGHQDSVKIRALQSLVAEQLLSLEAPMKGIGTDTLSTIRRRVLEHLLVRDELYKREVKRRVSVSKTEILQGLRRYPENVTAMLLRVRSQDEGNALSKVLKTSKNLDSTLQHLSSSLSIRPDTITLAFGGLDTVLENVAYSLSGRGRVSSPVHTESYGWAVLCFVNRATNPESAGQSLPVRSHAVETKIRLRKEVFAERLYAGRVLSPKRAKVKEELFILFADAALSLVRADSAGHRMKGNYILTGTDLDSLTLRFWSQINQELVELEGGGLQFGDIIEGFRNQRFLFPSLHEKEFQAYLSGSIKIIVQSELMAREGLAQNLQFSKQVVHDLDTWTNYWLARSLERRILQSVTVSDAEVMKDLVSHAALLGKNYSVNVREVLVDSLETALGVLERLNAGKDMAEIARRESKREIWAVHGGESGFFRVSEHPELGFLALGQDTGKLAGPVRLPEGYSVFTLLARKRAANDSLPSFDSLRNIIRRSVAARKGQQALNEYIASLASNHRVKMYYEKLASVRVMPTNMFTTRYLGFGGIMVAVPVISPQWEWVKEAKGIKDILP